MVFSKMTRLMYPLCMLWFCIAIITTNGNEDAGPSCPLQLRLTGDTGIGVYAGKDWTPGEVMETVVGVVVPAASVYWTQLVNYAEGFNETHALITMGFGMLYNHVLEWDKAMVRKHMSLNPGQHEFRSSDFVKFGLSYDVIFEPNSVIMKGEQILNYYGDDWFIDRNQVEINIHNTNSDSIGDENHVVPSLSLQTEVAQAGSMNIAPGEGSHSIQGSVLPGCAMTMVEHKQNRLFAAVDIEGGTVLEVSRGILLPDWSFPDNGPLGGLLWWGSDPSVLTRREELLAKRQAIEAQYFSPYTILPYEQKDTRYAMLLSGYGAFYGASNLSLSGVATDAIQIREPNVRYQWWSGNRTGPVQCDLLMMVSFTAMEFIEAGEELVVDMYLDSVTGLKVADFGLSKSCLF